MNCDYCGCGLPDEYHPNCKVCGGPRKKARGGDTFGLAPVVLGIDGYPFLAPGVGLGVHDDPIAYWEHPVDMSCAAVWQRIKERMR